MKLTLPILILMVLSVNGFAEIGREDTVTIEKINFSNGKSFNLVTFIVDGFEIENGVAGCAYKISKAMGKVLKIEIVDTSCPDRQIWEK